MEFRELVLLLLQEAVDELGPHIVVVFAKDRALQEQLGTTSEVVFALEMAVSGLGCRLEPRAQGFVELVGRCAGGGQDPHQACEEKELSAATERVLRLQPIDRDAHHPRIVSRSRRTKNRWSRPCSQTNGTSAHDGRSIITVADGTIRQHMCRLSGVFGVKMPGWRLGHPAEIATRAGRVLWQSVCLAR